MKKQIRKIVLLAVLVFCFQFTQASDCIDCSTPSEQECVRVSIGNTIHIYHGIKKPCQEEGDN